MRRKGKIWRTVTFVFIILLMSNINAIVDFFQHPEIPYFDEEHIIVGLIAGCVTFFFTCLIIIYINSLEKNSREREKLLSELIETRAKLEEEQSQLNKLNSDKDRFISILGHDLKNPLNTLSGLSEMLIEDIHELEIGEIETMANKIHSIAQNTNDLLDDILVWARMQNKSTNFNPQVVNFRNLCTEVLKTLTPIADEKNITINYSTQGETIVFADINMLKTILRNLVSNAIKFTNRNGKIIISAEENQQNVIVTVSDNGVGIELAYFTKLFNISEAFTSKGTENETGTGLGLVICKGFIEKHRGNIWVESEVGKGSDFKFTLPLYVNR